MRLTKEVRQKLLELNEGYTTHTSYEARNFSESRTYTIRDGKLHIRAGGKTSWADSRYTDEWVADEGETHRFLYSNLGRLNKNGID